MQAKTILAAAVLTAITTLVQAQDKSSEKDILTIYKGPHSYKEVSVAGKMTEVYVDDQKVADNEIPRVDSLIRAIKNNVDEDNRQWRQRDQAEERDWAQAQQDREQQQRDREQAQRDREQGERDRIQGQRDREQGQRDREQGQRDRERAKEDIATMREIIKYVIDQKTVDHVNSLVLTDAALYVNGVKQTDALHQTLKHKYADWAHNGVSYGNCQDCSSGIHVDFSDYNCCQ